MITHTKAFKTYRDLSQAHINFVVLTCYSVPSLKARLMTPDATLPTPDHFKSEGNTVSAILGYITKYQEELARSTLITVFSYFEAYLKDALQEVVEFHGGTSKLQGKARGRAQKYFQSVPPAIQTNKLKLQDRPVPGKKEKYQKHARILDKDGFRFPTDLLSHFGATQLILKIDENRGFKAHEIPSMLEDALLYPLRAADKSHFEQIRKARNGIAHGRASPLTLAHSLRYASFLHTLAAKIDSHIANS
jgi:RiboL-PSP-HEPN